VNRQPTGVSDPQIPLACKLREGFGNQGVMGKAVGLIGRRMSLERIRTMRSIGPEGVADRMPDIKSIAVAMVRGGSAQM